MAVTIRSVVGLTRAIPENPQETARAGSSETIRQPSRAIRDDEMVRSLRRRKEVGRNVRPADENVQLVRSLSNRISEIPCRVDELPLERAISLANPANNGETPPPLERAIPWEVGSEQLLDPVTTEVERPRWSSCREANLWTP